MSISQNNTAASGWRAKLQEVIFEADTPAGKLFDVALIVCIILSIFTVMLDSVGAFRRTHGAWLFWAEWVFTVLFSIEYLMRLISVRRPLGYVLSFFGIVDLLAVLPTYVSLFLPGTQYLIVIRVLRLLRVFRVFKLVQYVSEARVLRQALIASGRKITVFLFTVMTLVVIFGSLLYVIEGAKNGFTSIPRSIYWAIVTLTTVGYGDISPATSLGQTVSAVIMILGYSILAVPTGIVTVEMTRAVQRERTTQSCPECSADGHDPDAKHCKYCGAKL